MFSRALKEDLYHCLKCGICQQACPTFKATRREYLAPRGRVQVIKHYLDGDIRTSPIFRQAIMSCTLCDACSAMCPSGVRIDRVLRMMRTELADGLGPGFTKKILFSILRNSLLMQAAARFGRVGQRFLVDALGARWKMGNISLSRFPRLDPRSFGTAMAGRVPVQGKPVGRVLYFTGCATQLIYGDVAAAALDVLTALGFEVIAPNGLVCCGAPMFLAGFGRESLPNVLWNLNILDDPSADAIVVDCATCGAALKKEIPRLLEELGHDVEQAHRVAAKVRDVTELVAERLQFLRPASSAVEPLRVTYHDPCHLIRGMGIQDEPRSILRSLPNVSFVEMECSSECCGGAGSYQFENVELSGRITARKIEAILASGADIVATGCPGCRLTLAGNLPDSSPVRVLHTLQVVSKSLSARD